MKLLKPHVEYLIAQCITQTEEVKYMDKKAFQSVMNVYFSSFVFLPAVSMVDVSISLRQLMS